MFAGQFALPVGFSDCNFAAKCREPYSESVRLQSSKASSPSKKITCRERSLFWRAFSFGPRIRISSRIMAQGTAESLAARNSKSAKYFES